MCITCLVHVQELSQGETNVATPLEGNMRLSQMTCERQEASLEQDALKDVSPMTVHPSNSHPYVEQQSGIGCTERG